MYRRVENLRLNAKEKNPDIYARKHIAANSTITELPNYGLPCPKCGLKSIVRKQQQTRGNDEGASTGFFCNNSKCRHSWTTM